ncbi:hypothetical protein J7J47_19505 [Halomonas sp. ISL-60]|uniref:hypothetical protein n=1 Tax=Halomonas sp. ISL-56 TaxID=2819149 RepID=UPI001BEA3DF1|nr:hypothetical protein [Halomonas sp. ISL-56]MBT2774415.1 hypothetical protein [Halomonas sp. ISL-60]MBT2802362.1 hypothetical protein [Halomonas sp. ISL-56]
MVIQVDRLPISYPILSVLDSPDSASAATNGRIRIAGWAYWEGKDIDIVVDTGANIFTTALHLSRKDVAQHLQKRGLPVSQDALLGFKFDFMFTEKLRIGFKCNETIAWRYEIRETVRDPFRPYDSLEQLLDGDEGVYGNYYFHNSKDWSKLLVLFNGAVTRDKLRRDSAVFQRWSWADKFKHPVVVIADPLTTGDDSLTLGWYLGKSQSSDLPHLLNPLLELVDRKHPGCTKIGVGSSGGGFAALSGVLLGLLNDAIVINPQTDVLKFYSRKHVDAFLSVRTTEQIDSNLMALGWDQLKESSKVTFLQNSFDTHHYTEHYQPFLKHVESSRKGRHFDFIEYQDEEAGHSPPSLGRLARLIEDKITSLLK